MQLETIILTVGIASLILGLTILTLYNSFGPNAKKLLDPFEEDND